MKKILIIEDDMALAQELQVLLSRNNYEAEYLTKFSDVPNQVISKQPDMVLLDINLPEADGQNILKQIRIQSDVPVIMLTSKNTEMDEVLSMSFGADDFVAKPYNPSILLLHMEAVFKRYGATAKESVLVYGNLMMDVARGMLRVGEKCAELTKNEAGILGYLMQNQGRIVTRDELISYLWDSEEFVDDNTLTVNMNRVRKKLEELGFSDLIKTKRGQGYLLV